MAEIALQSESGDATRQLGVLVGSALAGGVVIELCGPLGAGKTQFAKGLAVGLGVDAAEPIVSPTFVLVREYRGRVRFCHCDAYRLGSAEELLELGLEEMVAESAVVAIEWADRFESVIAAPTLRIELRYVEGVEWRREVSIAGKAEMLAPIQVSLCKLSKDRELKIVRAESTNDAPHG